MTTIQQISLYVMAFLYAGAGVNHFVNPKFYLGIMPKFFPMPHLLNQVSGIALQFVLIYWAWTVSKY